MSLRNSTPAQYFEVVHIQDTQTTLFTISIIEHGATNGFTTQKLTRMLKRTKSQYILTILRMMKKNYTASYILIK